MARAWSCSPGRWARCAVQEKRRAEREAEERDEMGGGGGGGGSWAGAAFRQTGGRQRRMRRRCCLGSKAAAAAGGGRIKRPPPSPSHHTTEKAEAEAGAKRQVNWRGSAFGHANISLHLQIAMQEFKRWVFFPSFFPFFGVKVNMETVHIDKL